ncbi:MAG: hypothetical protein AAGC57_16810 [Pseudomonadota bacterium]
MRETDRDADPGTGRQAPPIGADAALALELRDHCVTLWHRPPGVVMPGAPWQTTGSADPRDPSFAEEMDLLVDAVGVRGRPALLLLPPEQVLEHELPAAITTLAAADVAAWLDDAVGLPLEEVVLAAASRSVGGAWPCLMAHYGTFEEARSYAQAWGVQAGPVLALVAPTAFGSAGAVFAPVEDLLSAATVPLGPAPPLTIDDLTARPPAASLPTDVPPEEPAPAAPEQAEPPPAPPLDLPVPPQLPPNPGSTTSADPPRTRPAIETEPAATGTARKEASGRRVAVALLGVAMVVGLFLAAQWRQGTSEPAISEVEPRAGTAPAVVFAPLPDDYGTTVDAWSSGPGHGPLPTAPAAIPMPAAVPSGPRPIGPVLAQPPTSLRLNEALIDRGLRPPQSGRPFQAVRQGPQLPEPAPPTEPPKTLARALEIELPHSLPGAPPEDALDAPTTDPVADDLVAASDHPLPLGTETLLAPVFGPGPAIRLPPPLPEDALGQAVVDARPAGANPAAEPPDITDIAGVPSSAAPAPDPLLAPPIPASQPQALRDPDTDSQDRVEGSEEAVVDPPVADPLPEDPVEEALPPGGPRPRPDPFEVGYVRLAEPVSTAPEPQTRPRRIPPPLVEETSPRTTVAAAPPEPAVTRRPPATPGTAVLPSTNATDLMLLGVFELGGQKSGLFRLPNGQVRTAQVGDEIVGWRILSFDDDRVRLARGGVSRSVALARP